MKAIASSAAVDIGTVGTYLPGWDYVDAYQIPIGNRRPASALAAARCVLPRSPAALRVLRVRDFVVRAAALKPAVSQPGPVDLFPVVHVEAHLAVVGFDDDHLDFRVLVDLTSDHVRCTTAVRRHNTLGRLYFAVVCAAHQRIVPHLLSRAAEHGWRASTAAAGPGQPHGSGPAPARP